MNRIIITTLLLILISLLLMTGCSPQPTPTPSPTPTSIPQAPQVGKRAPDFQLPDLEGQSVSLSEFQGKPVLLNFWATWCGPCRQEMPHIQGIFEEKSDTDLIILAVDIGEELSTVNNFLQNGNFSFTVLLDTKQEISLKYNIRAIPTTFFIDKDGIIQEIKVGAFSNTAEIEGLLSNIIP